MSRNKSPSTPSKKAATSPKKSPSYSPKKKDSPVKRWNLSPGRIISFDFKGSNVREQNLDLVETLVDGVYIGFCYKSWATNEASYLFPMEKSLNNKETGEDLAKDWKYVFGILPRRDSSIDDGTTAMKAKKGSKWDWKVILVVINDGSSADKVGRHIAAGFSKLTKSTDLMDSPEKYTYRQCFSDDPKPLNHYLLDLDVAKILRALGGYELKEELMEEEEVLTDFYGTPEFGREFLESLAEEDWENLSNQHEHE